MFLYANKLNIFCLDSGREGDRERDGEKGKKEREGEGERYRERQRDREIDEGRKIEVELEKGRMGERWRKRWSEVGRGSRAP